MNRFANITSAALARVQRDTGQRVVVSGKEYPVIAGTFESVETITDAGIRGTTILQMDILRKDAPDPMWTPGVVGTYEGRAIRLTPSITTHENGAAYRLTWEAR